MGPKDGCPKSCSKECQEKCKECAMCHMAMESVKEGGHPCDPFCMEGKCEAECKDADCNECDLTGDCKEPSKCPSFCTENCIPCAECHMEVEKMQKADEKKGGKGDDKKDGKDMDDKKMEKKDF